jgi:hypothetical protein
MTMGLITFFFKKKNYCLFNYMITKIDNRQIEHQTTTETCFKIL